MGDIQVRGVVSLLVCGGLMVWGSGTFGQPGGESDLSVKEAYQRGMSHYENDEYAEAVEYFHYALERQDHPVLRFNLSQAYVKLGEWERAIAQGEKVAATGELDDETGAKNRATILAGRRLLRGREAARAVGRSSAQQRGGDERGASGAPDPEEIAERREADAPPGLTASGWGGIGGIGAGIGLLTGAFVIERGLSSDFEAREEARRRGEIERAERLTSTIRSKQSTGRWLMYGGMGAVAVGTGLLIVDLVGSGEGTGQARAAFGVHPAPGGVRVGTSLQW